MSSSTVLPVVLVAEDDPIALEQMVGTLGKFDCESIGVVSHAEAIRVLHSDSAIDLVLTDIRLGVQQDDKSGVDLARYVRRTFGDLPVAGYSAVFTDLQLGSGEKGLFDRVWPKDASYRDVDVMMNYCRDRAFAHHRLRVEKEIHAGPVLLGASAADYDSTGHEQPAARTQITQIVHATQAQVALGDIQSFGSYSDLLDRVAEALEELQDVDDADREEARRLLGKLRSASGSIAVGAAASSGGALLGTVLKQLLGLP
jgi:CheY-like chemotaxis protein